VLFRVSRSDFRVAEGGAVKYIVTIGAQTVEVEVEGTRVAVGGVAREAQLSPLPGTPLYHLLLAGDSWTVAVEPGGGPGRWALGVVGERVEVEALDERSGQRRTEAAPRAGPTGSRIVKAPMPGLVVRIAVAAGQPVEAGAGLVVVEAMKMENELRAPHAGVVATVHVAVGQAVERGAPLVTLASPEASG
jgi:biotin carboxyl carrier protein